MSYNTYLFNELALSRTLLFLSKFGITLKEDSVLDSSMKKLFESESGLDVEEIAVTVGQMHEAIYIYSRNHDFDENSEEFSPPFIESIVDNETIDKLKQKKFILYEIKSKEFDGDHCIVFHLEDII